MTETSTADTTPAPDQPAPPHPWTELAAEQFHLLRLAPLPTDRTSGVRPLRFVQFGRVERHSPALSMLRLTVELPGQRLRREQNVLEVWADHLSKEVRFGADSGLQIEPANRGIGRFLAAQGIAWAKQRWAHYQVEGGALGIKDALSEDARTLRDHFLRVQGFEVEYLDPLQLKASYKADRVNVLHSDWHKDKVQIVSLLDAAAMLEQADRNLLEQDGKIRKLEERISVLRREDGTLRFTITCLIAFAVFQAGLLIWMATR